MFHPDPSAADRRENPANARVFMGNGTPHLRCPGLIGVERVVVGHTVIPLTEVRQYPMDTSLQRLQTVPEPIVRVTRDNDGTPVLMRSVVSNDGIWQDGVAVTVVGNWAAGEV